MTEEKRRLLDDIREGIRWTTSTLGKDPTVIIPEAMRWYADKDIYLLRNHATALRRVREI